MVATVIRGCVILAIICQTSAYTLQLCNKTSNVRYTVYYNSYNVNVNVYHCPVNETQGCEGIGESVPVNGSNKRILQECLTRAGKKGELKLPYYYENVGDNSTQFNISLCSFPAKAKPIANVIYLPPPFRTVTSIAFTSGQYFDKGLDVSIMWYLEYNCTLREIVYTGPVDEYSLEIHNRQKYLVGKSSQSDFSLALKKKIRVCNREMWLTDEYGVVASDSEPLEDVPLSRNRFQFTVRSEELKLCHLEIVTKELSERCSYLKDLLYRMVLGGIGVCLVFVVVVVFSVNYCLLKKVRSSSETEIYYKFSGSTRNDVIREPVVSSYLLPRECQDASRQNNAEEYAYADLHKARLRF